MRPENVHLYDWKRILIGTAPWSFAGEVLLRTVFLYVVLIAVLRIVGKRLSGQLTILELGLMITLGGIVSAPMVLRDKGVAIGVLLLCCALVFHRGVGWFGVVNERFERLAQGDVSMIVKDGELEIDALRRHGLSRNVLFAALRSKGLFQLGEVRRVYFEACGQFSILKADPPRPGLALFPEDEEIPHTRDEEASHACRSCGHVANAADGACERCGEEAWSRAVRMAS